MNIEKFENEITTLKKFYELYCNDKHENLYKKQYSLIYKSKNFKLELHLCESCHKNICYSFERVSNCKYEEKPKCRKCPTPCYEKSQWKNSARVMKYSSIKLSLGKIKSKVINIFN